MRHKYVSESIVLARSSLAEASTLVTLLTKDFGLVRARAQGLRKPGAKLASALQTLSQSDVTLLHGKEGWRLVGALLERNWHQELTPETRARAGRLLTLVLRLVSGETADPEPFILVRDFLQVLPEHSEEEQDALEILAALHILHVLGHDAGALPSGGYSSEAIAEALRDRKELVIRINKGIHASDL